MVSIPLPISDLAAIARHGLQSHPLQSMPLSISD